MWLLEKRVVGIRMKTKWNLELGKLLHRPALQPDEFQNKAINERVNVICFFKAIESVLDQFLFGVLVPKVEPKLVPPKMGLIM